MKKAVFGLARDEAMAQQIINNLVSANGNKNSISVLYPDMKGKYTNDMNNVHKKQFRTTEVLQI